MDSDRYKFELFAYRMLVAKSLNAKMDLERVQEWSRDSGFMTLNGLWSRAWGAAGTRPSPSQWVAALKRVRPAASSLQTH